MAGEVMDDIQVSGPDDAPAPPPVAAAAVPPPTPVPETAADPDDDDDGPAVDPASEAGKTLAKAKGSYKKRIGELTFQLREQERRAIAAEARLQERERVAAAAEPKKEPEKAETTYYTRPRPRVDEIGAKYVDWDAYNDDLQDWKLDERDAKKAAEARKESDDRASRDVLSKAQERIETFKKDHPDYDEVVSKAMIPQGAIGAHALIQHLNHSEFGAAMAYELAKAPAELARIASLPPAFVVEALGELKATIKARTAAAPTGPAPKTPDYKPANPPIKPVGSSPVASDDEGDPDDLSEAGINAHIKRENARDRERRRR